MLRAADGTVDVVHETHRTACSRRATWLRLLAAAGLRPDTAVEQTTEDRTPRTFFLGHVPAD